MNEGAHDKIPIRRALVSVYDKAGLEKLARGLHQAGVELVSTGGSATFIESYAWAMPGRRLSFDARGGLAPRQT